MSVLDKKEGRVFVNFCFLCRSLVATHLPSPYPKVNALKAVAALPGTVFNHPLCLSTPVALRALPRSLPVGLLGDAVIEKGIPHALLTSSKGAGPAGHRCQRPRRRPNLMGALTLKRIGLFAWNRAPMSLRFTPAQPRSHSLRGLTAW